LEEVHHEEAESDANGHVDEEEAEGFSGEGAEFVEAAELNDAESERGEDEWDDDEEKSAEENLADGIEDVDGGPMECGVGGGAGSGNEPGDDAENEPDEKAPHDAAG
jgi:hypothetical protein